MEDGPNAILFHTVAPAVAALLPEALLLRKLGTADHGGVLLIMTGEGGEALPEALPERKWRFL